jgi:hypothetical protein
MNSRIFPTLQSEKLDKSSVINTIDWSKFAGEMNKVAGIETENMTKVAAKKEEVVVKKAKRVKKQYGDCPECGVGHPCSCDVVKAQEEGNEEKVAALLEIRANRRTAQIAELEEVEAQEELNVRTAARSEVIDKLEKLAEDDVDEEAEDDDKCEECCESPCECKGKKDEKCEKCDKKTCVCSTFESVASLSAQKKAVFAKYADAMGWPREYVEAVTASSIKLASIPEATKMVLDNKELESSAKRQIVTAMHKEAKLAPEQASRIKSYWSKELGYPDTEWIDDLVAEPTGK